MLTCYQLAYKNRFHGLGFSLTPGALLALYGEDAMGVLMLMAGMLKPTQGEVVFEGKPIARSRDYHELTMYIGSEVKLRPWHSVQKAVTKLAKAGGGAKELVEAAMRYWGLSEKREEKCGTLTPALRKRVWLTQLLTLPRPVWLLDYPEKDLDIEGLGMLDALIANRCNQDGIVVLATTREKFMEPLPALYLSDFK